MTAPAAAGGPGEAPQWARCAAAIEQRVSDGRYPGGQWLPPMKEIRADLGGADHGRVQRALHDLCERGVISLAESAGYYAGTGPPPPSPPAGSLFHVPTPRPARTATPPDSPRAQLLAEQYVTVTEFATVLRTSPMTVYRLIASGEIGGVIRVTSQTFRIPVASAQEFIRGRHVSGEQLDLDQIAAAGAADDSE